MKKKINVLNHDLSRLTVLDDYESLYFERKYNDVGEFILTVDTVTSKQAKLLSMGVFIMLDTDTRKIGIITNKKSNDNSDGTSNFVFKGKTLGAFLDYREIIVGENESSITYTGNVESIMYYYVQNHCINPYDNARKIPLLTASKDTKSGDSIRWTTKEERVLNTIKTLSEIYEYGWQIKADIKNNELVFDVYMGRDLTLNNPNVDNPVVFSKEFENIYSMSYTEDINDERTFAYTVSDGTGSERKLYESKAISGLERKEITLKVNSNEDGEYIDVPERSAVLLNEYAKINTVDAEIRDCKMFKFEKDYDLGDLVTVQNKNWGLNENMRIISIQETIDKDGHKIEARFGSRILSIIDKLKRENKILNV